MDRRRERRLNLELPVRIWESTGWRVLSRRLCGCATSAIAGGSDGLRSKVQTGEVLDVQHGASRAQFRIVWMSLTGEAGVEALAWNHPSLHGHRHGMRFGLPRFLRWWDRIGQRRRAPIGQLTWIHVAGSILFLLASRPGTGKYFVG